MSDFHMEVINLPAWVYRMRGADRVIDEEMVRSTDRLTISGERFSKEGVPYKTRHLMRSLTSKPARLVGRTAIGQWGTNVPYAEKAEHQTASRANQARGRGPGYMAKSLAQVKAAAPGEFQACTARIVSRLGGGR